jgi:uncharacterized protein YecT (DUF1311 family)
LSLLIGGCGKAELDCGSGQSIDTVIPIFQEQVERLTREGIVSEDGTRLASHAEVRALLDRLNMQITDVRTASRDPNSTKRFCSSRLVISIPKEIINEADATRRETGADSVTSAADRNDIEQQADKFLADVEYSVQPTDDGKSIFAEVIDSGNVEAFLSDVLIAQLSSRAVRRFRAEEQAALLQQRQQEAAQAQEQARAATEQQQASLTQARVDSQLAAQVINEVWRGIPKPTRDRFLEQQRAWMRRKAADCRVEAASASIDPNEREIARLTCEARSDRYRADQLRPYISLEPNPSPVQSRPADRPYPRQQTDDNIHL